MFEKLTEFLIAEKKEQQESLPQICEKRIILLQQLLFDIVKCEISFSFSKASSEAHKEKINKFNEKKADYDYLFSEVFPMYYIDNIDKFNAAKTKDDLVMPIIDSNKEIFTGNISKFWENIIQNDELQIDCFGYLLSPKFEAPNEPVLIILFLQLLLIYYAYLAFKIPVAFTVNIDTVAMEIVRAATIAISLYEKVGQQHDRTIKSTDGKRKSKRDRKQDVLETYYKIRNRVDLKPHRIASIILEQMGERAPSLSTIKRYLAEERLI
jgi:hypothetical protein